MIVRVAGADDAAAIAAVYAPAVVEGFASFEEQSPSAQEMARRMDTDFPWLVADVAGEVVGWASGSPHRARPAYRWSAEVTAYVSPAHHGQGIGRALYDELLPRLTAHGLASLYAGIALPNPGSIALHEAVGFRQIGTFPRVGFKHGQWRDVGWWWLPLHDRPVP